MLTDAVEIIEDFSGGQFEMLPGCSEAEIQRLAAAAEECYLYRSKELSEWGQYVTVRLLATFRGDWDNDWFSDCDSDWKYQNRDKYPPYQRKIQKGYVYVIQAPIGLYKIGMSLQPEKRIAALSKGLPFPVVTVLIIQTDDMRGLESDLHAHFDLKRVNGEWFNLDADDITFIRGFTNGN